MLESALSTLLRTVLLAGLADRGYSDVLVKANYQPRQQGVPIEKSLFVHQLGFHRYGYPKKEYIFNSNTSEYDYVETIIKHSKYQIAGLWPQSPGSPAGPTATDLLTIASDILQHNDALAIFKTNNVGILRIMDINTIYFENDRGQNEANPTFECVFGHTDVYTKPGVAVTRIRNQIFPI